jgi:hypothetical protein
VSVRIPKTSQPSDEDLRNLSIAVGHDLPQTYVDFVRVHDGAEPESNSVRLRQNESGVRRFISAREASSVLSDVDGFPSAVVPLAEDGCGNFFYVDPKSGGVHFWDHELDGPDELVAADLNGFLEKLAQFDAAQFKLAPGQVRSAWVNPDFKPKF